MLRHFGGAFDFVHRLNSGRAISGCDVDRRRAAASPFVIGIERRMDRMQWNSAGAKPVRDFTEVLLAVGIVEMLAGSEDLYRLSSAAD